MIVVDNIITLCKYVIHKTIRFIRSEIIGIDSIEFEYLDEDKDDNEMCYCNLCNTFRNIILFTTRHLKCIKNKNYLSNKHVHHVQHV